jgi:hypothetical protein
VFFAKKIDNIRYFTRNFCVNNSFYQNAAKFTVVLNASVERAQPNHQQENAGESLSLLQAEFRSQDDQL